jgi:hypothetical protein
MRIIGCDLHARQQTVALSGTAFGCVTKFDARRSKALYRCNNVSQQVVTG